MESPYSSLPTYKVRYNPKSPKGTSKENYKQENVGKGAKKNRPSAGFGAVRHNSYFLALVLE